VSDNYSDCHGSWQLEDFISANSSAFISWNPQFCGVSMSICSCFTKKKQMLSKS
jgi:hypothetical protein